MDTFDTRPLVGQLADDLSWLEGHCRRQPDLAAEAGRLRLAAALVRNCVGPFVNGQNPRPLHLAVVGGAGAGKSTVVNFLTGTAAAEANPQAGYTRHPTAYVGDNGPLAWAGHAGFLGPLTRLTGPAPANLDEDVYQVRRLPAPAETELSLLRDFVVWDCPDMTTWAAGGYVPRLLEVAGLADVIVYVASDERYNDEVPTQFLKALIEAGKPVVVVLTKMRESQAQPLLDHFRSEVLAKVQPKGGMTACLAVPFLGPEELADPAATARYRIPLVNQVGVLADQARPRAVRAGTNFLLTGGEGLLASARRDVEALASWRDAVNHGQDEFVDRYRREHLTGERFRRFDDALVRLIDLLELPGPGKALSTALWVIRTPYRLARDVIGKALARPEGVALPERDVLEMAFRAWLDALRAEALKRSGTHPLWKHAADGFDRGLSDTARGVFEDNVRRFQAALGDEVDRTSRAIYADLERNPATLNALRGVKFTADAAAVGVAAFTGGLSPVDFVTVPLAASATHQLAEWMGRAYVDKRREELRARQLSLVTQRLSSQVANFLANWPASGGSPFERLRQALDRVPRDLKRLGEAVEAKFAAAQRG